MAGGTQAVADGSATSSAAPVEPDGRSTDEYCVTSGLGLVEEICALVGAYPSAAARMRMLEGENESVQVELGGEFDIAVAGILGERLLQALRQGLMVFVDLSGVTFLDATCVYELLSLNQLYPRRIALRDPSWQAELSMTACGLNRGILTISRAGERGALLGDG